ncbi:MAG TPA: polymer-forming cytoskeletal protein [Flavobacteriaceae bacterium]|nr:polymer-forming cytoskeletal protein [Flavobacteriaceae bacterium]
MFSDNKRSKSSAVDHSKEQNKIAQGTKIVGDIVAKGGVRIEGTVEGTIKTPGKVVVGKTGHIQGKIECESADIEGKFSGNLLVSETLSLRSTAVIEGEVVIGKLSIEPGATFNATCAMKGGVKILKDERRKESQNAETHGGGFQETIGS